MKRKNQDFYGKESAFNIILFCTVLLQIPHRRSISVKYEKELRLTINKMSAKSLKDYKKKEI
jgi:hypothetical protein